MASASAAGDAALGGSPESDKGDKEKAAPDPSLMKACAKFIMGKCSKSSCPQAHPGLRDRCEPFVTGGTGSRKRYAVRLCPEVLAHAGDWMSHCSAGAECRGYHP